MAQNSLLKEQLQQHLDNSTNDESLTPLIQAVSDAFDQSEEDKRALEASVREQNAELALRNEELNNQVRELQKTKAALQESYSLLQASLSSTYDALVMLDNQGSIRLSNPNFNKMFRMNTFNAGLAHVHDFIEHCQCIVKGNHHFSDVLKLSLAAPEKTFTHELQTYDGRWLEAHSKAHWHDNEIVGQVWSFRDVTALKLKEKEAKHRTFHDFLTGLPNRRSLLSRLKKSVNAAQKTFKDVVVMFIDLDGFKDVNDSLGHSVGDSLLIEVARRMESKLPECATLTRHGGDEFVAILGKQTSLDEATAYSERILSCFSKPYHIGKQDIYMSVSIGIATLNMHGNDSERLITYANLAMTQAKKQGSNIYQVYDASVSSQCEHRLRIRNEINQALENDQFELFFQPKICLESGSIKGAEALIRWRMTDGSFRSPMEFIPIAEESGQIIPITQWVIRRCCEYLNEWMPHLDSDFVLALNISAKHFQKGLLQRDVASVLKEIQAIPSMLELEVTETAIMEDIELAVSTLNELKRLGIRTAIDDFGTGYSSLSYLRKLPIEVLKIDKSFIDEILESPEDRTLVKGIIDMVHALGIEVVAEGVENHQMAVLLQNMNCDLVQGYHYCKPIEESEFLHLIKESLCYI
ncbi:MAG: EAL domain-containing protein [Oleiphilaceae bacterium]|nr:EAL domain-containing protein [Oleiphilaceae bacterium]